MLSELLVHNDLIKLFEYKRLEALVGYCEAISCRRKALLGYFDQEIQKCENCDNCIHPPSVEDYSNEAKIIILTIQSTGQYFGTNHIIDVIKGNETLKVRGRSHNRLACFGQGAQLPKGLIQALIRQLIAFGALRVNLGKYGAIEINEAALDIVKGTKIDSKLAQRPRAQITYTNRNKQRLYDGNRKYSKTYAC